MNGGAWWAAVHEFAKSQTRLSDFPFAFHFHALEKEMETHSSALAWRIPGMGEPGGLPSMGSHRVGHNRSDLAAAAAELKTKITLCLLKNHTIQLPNLTNKETEAPKLIEKFKSVLAGGSNQEVGSLPVRCCSPCRGLQLVQFHPHFPSFSCL